VTGPHRSSLKLKRHTAAGWSVDVFRQVRRADLRTGYAGPKPSLIARVHRAALNLIGRRPIP